MNGKVKNTVKKYLAQVIWKKDNSALKYLAIVSIKGKTQKTVKKYLAHVIWKKDNSELKYLAMVSIKGRMAHAKRL